jgi:hypothetical protein
MKTPKELKARYPYMFEGRSLGISFAKGWFKLFAQLCMDIDTALGIDKHGFQWTQVKEKFGSCRFYWYIKGRKSATYVDVQTPDGVVSFVNNPPAKGGADFAATVDKINELVEAASQLTNHLCIVCGDQGKAINQSGYTLVLCKKHASREPGKPLDIWFNDDEE